MIISVTSDFTCVQVGVDLLAFSECNSKVDAARNSIRVAASAATVAHMI